MEKNIFQLDDLINPLKYNEPIEITGFEKTKLIDYYKSMLLIRLCEQHLGEARKNGMIGGPVHLGVGQEAVAVGISSVLRKSDRVFGAHRSHSHVLALGSKIQKLFSEIVGKNSGLSKGMGGSMHLWDQSNGFYGSTPIVAGTISLAVGAALAAKMQKKGDIAIAYLGDGAVEEGVFHESLNLAKILNVPIVFVVENNLFASHMHISTRQPLNSTARFAEANNIPWKVIDGNNVLEVAEVAKNFVTNSRIGGGPALIEAITHRWYGHVDWREDIDVGVNRSQDDLMAWRKRDPIERLSKSLIESEILNLEMQTQIQNFIKVEINNAWNEAINDPFPEECTLLDRVFATK